MVERKVSFGIDLNPGVSQLRQQLASVEQLSKNSMLSIQHAQERHNLRMQEMRNKLKQIENDGFASNVAAHKRAVQSIEQEEQRHALRMKQMQEKAQLEATQGGGFRLSSVGHIAQSLGFYRTGHLIRAADQMGIGSRLFSAGGAEGAVAGAEGAAVGAEGGAAAAAGGLAAVGAVALPLAIGIGAVIVAGKGLEMAFEGMKATAQAFISGVSQLGGARGLEQMVVEAGENQTRVQRSRMTVAPGERLSSQEINKLAQELSERPDLGGFTKEKWIGAINEIGTVSSRQKSFGQSSWEFIGRMSNLGGMEPSEAAKVYGSVAHANPRMNDQQIQQILLSGIGIGREETFNVGEIPEAGGVIQSAYKIGGERSQAMNRAFGLAGLIKPHTKSGTLSEAGTNEEALLRAMEGTARMGNTNIKTNNLGQITNMGEALRYVLTTPEAQLPKHLTARKESEEAINALKIEAGITTTDTTAQASRKIDAMLAKFDTLGISMDQFIHETNEVTGPEQQLKARFNELADAMESKLIALLENGSFQKAFNNVIDFLIANAPTLELAIQMMIDAFNLVAPAIWSMTEAVVDVVAGLANDPTMKLLFPDLAAKTQALAESFHNARQQHELQEKYQGTEYPADFTGPLPPGAHKKPEETVSTPVVHRPDKEQTQSSVHLESLKTLQQKQLDVLNAIRLNTMKGVPPAPDRTTGGH